jgi:hypothetical protein
MFALHHAKNAAVSPVRLSHTLTQRSVRWMSCISLTTSNCKMSSSITWMAKVRGWELLLLITLPYDHVCPVARVEDWLHGSFNVCILVTVKMLNRKQQPGECALLRIPLPYWVAKAFRPGNGDKKIHCEAGTYAWLQENCLDVPIPRLYGFAMSTGKTVRR